MQKNNMFAALILVSMASVTPVAHAFGVSHHGGIILDCTPPLFFDESPAKEARVQAVSQFSFVASDNTDAETLKVWANNQPVPFEVKTLRSGRLAVTGKLPEAVTEGKVWFKVTGISTDGCDQLHNWTAYVGD